MTPAEARPRAKVARELVAAKRKLVAASERRRALPPGSSRARVTTANARWSIAAETVDRLLAELAAVEAA